LLDGDNLRTGINNNLGFSEEDRLENIRRSAETAKLFLNCGVITICSFISPTRDIREMAKNIIGEKDFFEVYVNCPFEICEQRDVKGLYKKARNGEIKNFTGLDAPFEAPANPELEIRTDLKEMEACRKELFETVYKKVKV
jgi:adenylylsulfate kinase